MHYSCRAFIRANKVIHMQQCAYENFATGGARGWSAYSGVQ
jgi:hypothetical protein